VLPRFRASIVVMILLAGTLIVYYFGAYLGSVEVYRTDPKAIERARFRGFFVFDTFHLSPKGAQLEFVPERLRGGAFDGQALTGGQQPAAIEWPTERIDHASQQSVAHGNVHDSARALDFIACVQMPVFAEQHDADFVLVHVESDAEHIAWKLY
jgi:hypothetical protein